MSVDIMEYLVEFFDLEVDESIVARKRRLATANECLKIAAFSPQYHGRICELISASLVLIESLSRVTPEAEELLALILHYTRDYPDRYLRTQTLRKVTSLLSGNLSGNLSLQMAKSLVRDADLTAAGELLRNVPPCEDKNHILAQLFRIRGEIDQSELVLAPFTSGESLWQRGISRFIALNNQGELIELLHLIEKENPDPEKRLVSFIYAVASSRKPVHHRLQTPGNIARHLVRRKQDPQKIVHLLDCALLISGFPEGDSILSALDWLEKIEVSAGASSDLELELIILAAAIRVTEISSVAKVKEHAKKMYYAAVARTQPPKKFDPFQFFEEKSTSFWSRLPRKFALPAAMMNHMLKARSLLAAVPEDREIMALKAWVSILLDTGPEFRGYMQKSAQFSTQMLEIMTGKEFPELERSYYSSDGMTEIEADKTISESGLDRTRFQRIDLNAFATGSIGQVHQAVTLDGTAVALKVKYPGIVSKINSDLSTIRKILSGIKMVRGADAMDYIASSFSEIVINQTDFVREANVQARLAEALLPLTDVGIPQVFTELCVEGVIVQQLIKGQSWHQFCESATREEKSRAGVSIVRGVFKMLAAGFYYSDFHPANFQFANEKVWFLDFGAVNPVVPGVGEFIAIIAGYLSGDEEHGLDVFCRNFAGSQDRSSKVRSYELFRTAVLKPWISNKTFRFTRKFSHDVLSLMRQELNDDLSKIPVGNSIVNLKFVWMLYHLLSTLEAEADWTEVLTDLLQDLKKAKDLNIRAS